VTKEKPETIAANKAIDKSQAFFELIKIIIISFSVKTFDQYLCYSKKGFY